MVARVRLERNEDKKELFFGRVDERKYPTEKWEVQLGKIWL
jgi:hypothetical protein